MTLAIEAHALTKTFPTATGDDVHALRGIDVEVPEGQIFGFLGRNGQGKSTTMRILTGLTLPTTGTARVAGLDVITQRRQVQRHIGATLQEVALDDLQTGREHLVLIGSLWGRSGSEATRRADELLEEFGLTDAASRLIRGYSGGMRRRLDLATSLLNEPRVLFLDEPTTGLDPQSRRSLWGRIRQLQSAGTTVYLTTQYLEEADEIAIIDGGTILACGSPDRLRTTYGTTRIEMRITDPARRERTRRELDDRAEIRGEWVRTEMADAAEAARLLGRLGGLGLEADELTVHTSSLEDVFLDLTGTGINGHAGQTAGVESPTEVAAA